MYCHLFFVICYWGREINVTTVLSSVAIPIESTSPWLFSWKITYENLQAHIRDKSSRNFRSNKYTSHPLMYLQQSTRTICYKRVLFFSINLGSVFVFPGSHAVWICYMFNPKRNGSQYLTIQFMCKVNNK